MIAYVAIASATIAALALNLDTHSCLVWSFPASVHFSDENSSYQTYSNYAILHYVRQDQISGEIPHANTSFREKSRHHAKPAIAIFH